jgi:predicted RND superfamily exporter protein
LAVPIACVSAAGIPFLKVTTNTRVFFDEHNPDYQALKAFENIYSKRQSIFFVLAPDDGNVFTRKTLAAAAELTEAGWQVPYAATVSSLTNYPYLYADGDDLLVKHLVPDPCELSEADLDRIRGIALSEPAILNSLISAAGHVTGVYVSLILPPGNRKAVPEVAAYARAMEKDFRARHPRIEIHLTGSIMIDRAFAEASENDLRRLSPIAFVAMTTLAGIALRSFYGTLAAVLVTALSMLTAMGLIGWCGVPLNAVSVGAPGLILTLSIADNIHILTSLSRLARQGRSKHEAVAESLAVNFKAVLLTNITTIIGFLSMNFSESPPFRHLGAIVGAGVAIDLVNSVLLLPALMAVLPLSSGSARERRSWIDQDRLADFVIRRRDLLLRSMLLLTAVCSIGMLGIVLDDNFLTYFDESFDFRRATDFLIKNLGGWDTIEYSLNSGQPSGITDPQYMAVVDRFAGWYRQQPKVVRVFTIVDTIKRMNEDMHGGDASYYRVPDRRDMAAQYLLFYELSLPSDRDINNQIDVDKSCSRLAVNLGSMSAEELCQLDDRAYRWLQANAPQHMISRGTGLSLIWARITRRNIRSMLYASLAEILTISAIMIVALRRLRFVVLFLIPNLVPPFIAFGIWGVTKGRVGLALSVVAAMTLGIIVDDTIHFFITYFHARRREGMSPEQAVRHAFGTVGTAIGITTLVLMSGFVVMMLSHYRMTSEMGLLCTMVIGLALAAEFFLSPTLLMRFDRSKDKPDRRETRILLSNRDGHSNDKNAHGDGGRDGRRIRVDCGADA